MITTIHGGHVLLAGVARCSGQVIHRLVIAHPLWTLFLLVAPDAPVGPPSLEMVAARSGNACKAFEAPKLLENAACSKMYPC